MSNLYKEISIGELMDEFSIAEIREVAMTSYKDRGELIQDKYLSRINNITSTDENHPAYWGYLFEYVYSLLPKEIKVVQ